MIQSKNTTYVLFCGRGSFVRRLEMMVFLVHIANDVIVYDRVLARAEVPRLFLRVVRSIFEPLQLVLEIEDVVGLLVAECSVFILCERLDRILFLLLSNLRLARWICEGLCDWIVLHFLSLYKLTSNFFIGFWLTLKVIFSRMVLCHILAPRSIAIVQAERII